MMKKIDFEILADLHVLSLSEYEKVVFGTSPGCMRVCMYVRFPVA
jgi:hypothetical protein